MQLELGVVLRRQRDYRRSAAACREALALDNANGQVCPPSGAARGMCQAALRQQRQAGLLGVFMGHLQRLAMLKPKGSLPPFSPPALAPTAPRW